MAYIDYDARGNAYVAHTSATVSISRNLSLASLHTNLDNHNPYPEPAKAKSHAHTRVAKDLHSFPISQSKYAARRAYSGKHRRYGGEEKIPLLLEFSWKNGDAFSDLLRCETDHGLFLVRKKYDTRPKKGRMVKRPYYVAEFHTRGEKQFSVQSTQSAARAMAMLCGKKWALEQNSYEWWSLYEIFGSVHFDFPFASWKKHEKKWKKPKKVTKSMLPPTYLTWAWQISLPEPVRVENVGYALPAPRLVVDNILGHEIGAAFTRVRDNSRNLTYYQIRLPATNRVWKFSSEKSALATYIDAVRTIRKKGVSAQTALQSAARVHMPVIFLG